MFPHAINSINDKLKELVELFEGRNSSLHRLDCPGKQFALDCEPYLPIITIPSGVADVGSVPFFYQLRRVHRRVHKLQNPPSSANRIQSGAIRATHDDVVTEPDDWKFCNTCGFR